MTDGGITRRQALFVAAAGAATAGLAGRAGAAAGLTGLQAELVTVTQRGFAAWWPTDALADTTVRIARADGGWEREYRLATAQTVHAARIDGLRPGTTYNYELRSGGARIGTSAANPGKFTTLPRLEGRRLATIAVLNDLHVGEQCSGTITSIGDESFPPCFKADDYAYRMCEAAMREIRRIEPDLLIANGDLTDRGRPNEVGRCLELLRSSGLRLFVTRGNHDRRFHEADAECGGDGDCLRDQAFPANDAWDHALTSVARVGRRVGVVGLDSCDPESGSGRLDLGGQLDWLERKLATLKREGRIPLVCFHHHVATQANATHPPPLFFGVNALQGGLDALGVIGR